MNEPRTITVVDDDPSVRKALARLFRLQGFDVRLFDSCESLMENDVMEETDCLVLDVNLPGKSGLEFQQQLRDSASDCPIVFISSYDNPSFRATALQNGAVEFLGKPLKLDVLLEVIERALNETDH